MGSSRWIYIHSSPQLWIYLYHVCVAHALPRPHEVSSPLALIFFYRELHCVSLLQRIPLCLSEVGGENRRFPDRESKPGARHPHRTHRTHDTTDQWRVISSARAKPPENVTHFRVVASRVPSLGVCSCTFLLISARKNNAFLQAADSRCSSHLIKITVLWISYSSQFQKCNTSNIILRISYSSSWACSRYAWVTL